MSAPLTEYEWNGLTCVGRVILDDWEGDASVPRGKNYWPPYVEDLEIFAGDTNIYEHITEKARDDIIEAMIENYTQD